MMVWADCRRCIYFIPVEEMPDSLKRRAMLYLRQRRPGAKLLGWCRRYERPVTYYEGYCNGFKPVPDNVRPLTKFMDRG